jgi:hypothetical protein
VPAKPRQRHGIDQFSMAKTRDGQRSPHMRTPCSEYPRTRTVHVKCQQGARIDVNLVSVHRGSVGRFRAWPHPKSV